MSGRMFNLERGEDGLPRAVPTEQTYADVTGEPDPQTPRPEPTNWYISKRTDPEPGETPSWDELSHEQRIDWLGTAWIGGDETDDYVTGFKVWQYLCDWIPQHFPGVHAMRTPALTGCLMIEHTLPWASDRKEPYRYHQLAGGLGRLVAATTTPHRMELLTLPSRPMLREYRVYDARVSYAAWLRSLPIITEDAPATHDHESLYEPYTPGRYLCAVTVPKDWRHIGLARRMLPDLHSYDYPTAPGLTWTTWLEEPELRLLHEQSWPYTVQERILYAPKRARGSDPLRVFCERMFPELLKLDAAPSNPARRALRHAYRALLTQPVGLWHRGSVKAKRPIADPRDVQPGEELDSEHGQLLAVTHEALSGPVSRWRRPEWAATIYGYEHAQVMRKALSVPRSALLAIRGDAIHLADHETRWEDTGKVGCYRLKEAHDFGTPRPAPRTLAELGALEKAARDA